LQWELCGGLVPAYLYNSSCALKELGQQSN
jgi:hypothetical protein